MRSTARLREAAIGSRLLATNRIDCLHAVALAPSACVSACLSVSVSDSHCLLLSACPDTCELFRHLQLLLLPL